MKVKIIKCASGFYAVMVWDSDREAWSCFWSGSRKLADAVREADKIIHGRG